ncbi:MAG: transcriptional regulator [Gammaproteobacteria bacterium RIFCSPHIGHO2_12_FULL_43_28]|nr:MAG: transcriptional regulator [Gammaproteobacteria bacterium RIFCSPHIGHO2_12_FULL_43_28]
MPEISRFFGIIIAMYYQDHNPPHFHVRYNEYKASVSIEDLAILDGKLSPKALGLVIEWASQHQDELMEDWKLAEKLAQLKPIKPLE